MIIPAQGVLFGSDPELFVKIGDTVIGSERVIPNDGVEKVIVRDGVQIELHPNPRPTAIEFSMGLGGVMKMMRNHLAEFPDVEASFEPVVEVTLEELEQLSPESQVLGCGPSKNIYGFRRIQMDGMKYLKRSAGGHIHFGLLGTPLYSRGRIDHRERLVAICDKIIGNTCTLLDRDEAQKERRKLYGRVGEYRTPQHGLEYRTLSNFWLRSPILTQLVFGLAEMAVSILNTTVLGTENLEAELNGMVDVKNVIRSVQTNDSNLAWANWLGVREFIRKHATSKMVLNSGNLDRFEKVINIIGNDGLDSLFKGDVMWRWTNKEVDGGEWGRFIDGM